MDYHRDWNALFEKYLSGASTPEDIEFLFQEFGMDADEEALRRLIRHALGDDGTANPLLEEKVAAFTEKVGSNLQREITRLHPTVHPRRRTIAKKWLAVAALLVAFLSVGTLWYFLDRDNRGNEQMTSKYGGEVLPGGNRATLTLTDGRTVELSANQDGIVVGDEITYADGTSVAAIRTDGGSIAHLKVDNLQLTTPKGGQYQITLPDGSKVWLNSASTLKYPSRFDSKERVVELVGEAYFEVSHRLVTDGGTQTAPSKIPFLVKTRDQIVNVLGTSFNISAYAEDEDTKTTLVAGSVKVANTQQSVAKILVPNQQAVLHGNNLSVSDVDVAPYVDWKDGLFSFQETSLQDAMRQLSRWYDLEVMYDRSVPATYFFGKIRRDNSLSSVLKILQKSGLNFKITHEGGKNRLTVLP